MHAEDIAANQAMGRHGATLMPASGGVLTHCNAGALATAGYGTALGVIRAAVEQGKKIHVYADETRPFLQGSRLTAWELMKDGIPTTVISDNMAGVMMQQGKIEAIVVGADRIAANGDVANKIGTYTVAILAKEHGIPFYVAAPISTVDLATPDGSKIPIEQRNAREVTHIGGRQMTPDGVEIENPAFDVTPAKYVAAIITERGIARAPYENSLRDLAAEIPKHP
jgi:methylthioribose-1-phosphate isomerase